MKARIIVCALLAADLTSSSAAAAECGMALEYSGPSSTAIWKGIKGPDSFYFQSNSDVNTDGSGRSYHPEDIAANKGLAQNILCNGVNRKVGGASASCVNAPGDCQKCLDQFRSVALPEMISKFTKYFQSFAIATKGTAACVVPPGQTNAGYFVSTTSYRQPDKDACDPARYLDAMVFPAIAVPKSLISRGVGMGDFVLVRNRANGRMSLGVVYDSSGGRIGESSIAMNRQLLCQKNHSGCVAPPIPNTLKQSYGLVVDKAEYLIFAGSAKSWPDSPDAVQTTAEALFNKWGGRARLDACGAAYSH